MNTNGTTSPKLMAAYTRLSNIGVHVVNDESGNLRVVSRAEVTSTLVLTIAEADSLALVIAAKVKQAALAVEGRIGTSSPKPPVAAPVSRSEMIERLSKAQNAEVNATQDIMTITGFMSDAEVAKHLARYEERALAAQGGGK